MDVQLNQQDSVPAQSQPRPSSRLHYLASQNLDLLQTVGGASHEMLLESDKFAYRELLREFRLTQYENERLQESLKFWRKLCNDIWSVQSISQRTLSPSDGSTAALASCSRVPALTPPLASGVSGKTPASDFAPSRGVLKKPSVPAPARARDAGHKTPGPLPGPGTAQKTCDKAPVPTVAPTQVPSRIEGTSAAPGGSRPQSASGTSCNGLPFIKYWDREAWKEAYKALREDPTAKRQSHVSVRYRFVEFDPKHGGPNYIVFGYIRRARGKAARTWRTVDEESRNDINEKLVKEFPELGWGEDNWKASEVAWMVYPSWYKGYGPKEEPTPPSKRPAADVDKAPPPPETGSSKVDPQENARAPKRLRVESRSGVPDAGTGTGVTGTTGNNHSIGTKGTSNSSGTGTGSISVSGSCGPSTRSGAPVAVSSVPAAEAKKKRMSQNERACNQR
ncbi:hypothetical protein CERSUDRAFT_77110 [Gelatoporia subvermispora B]|uniref:Uncharacterized protein n=1 Tax=Ceriporiopsis subvermispora (strain B) TaxID=914234 RepID=M2QKQ6_CERS8|nr:hypothetical protein CERSUDRAFT_77110 [Gelatoporia subvermispora B]